MRGFGNNFERIGSVSTSFQQFLMALGNKQSHGSYDVTIVSRIFDQSICFWF